MPDQTLPRLLRHCSTCAYNIVSWDEEPCFQGVARRQDGAWHGDNDPAVRQWRESCAPGACPGWAGKGDSVSALEAEADRLSGEADRHKAAAEFAVKLLQRTVAALRALDVEASSSWGVAELHLGEPLTDQTLRGLADHVEGKLRRGRR
jgi:hypothetical protein